MKIVFFYAGNYVKTIDTSETNNEYTLPSVNLGQTTLSVSGKLRYMLSNEHKTGYGNGYAIQYKTWETFGVRVKTLLWLSASRR